jgi:hypothetical protein
MMSSYDKETEERRKELQERYREIGRKNIEALESAIEKRINQGMSREQIITEVETKTRMHRKIIKRKVGEVDLRMRGANPGKKSFFGRFRRKK